MAWPSLLYHLCFSIVFRLNCPATTNVLVLQARGKPEQTSDVWHFTTAVQFWFWREQKVGMNTLFISGSTIEITNTLGIQLAGKIQSRLALFQPNHSVCVKHFSWIVPQLSGAFLYLNPTLKSLGSWQTSNLILEKWQCWYKLLMQTASIVESNNKSASKITPRIIPEEM